MTDSLLYQVLRIRRVEEAICREYPKLEMRTPTHISIGEEQIAVGVCSNLRKTDKVFSSHRAHAHYLAKGGDLKRFIAELHGKAAGCCNGIGGSMHLQDPEAGFIASTSIVGGTVPVAVGSSFADKIRGIQSVTAVFFGDGCMEEGVVGESFNFAVLHNLPIVFVCSNNGLAVTTPLKYRQPQRSLTALAEAYGLESDCTLSSDPYVIQEMSKYAIDAARQGKPQFLEIKTERQRVHCGVEWERDLTNDRLKGYTTDESEIHREIAEAFEFARNSPAPTNPELGVFA